MKENRAFLILHAVFLAFVLVGFGRSFYLAPLFGDPAGLDTPLRIHGWVLTAWFAITVAQGWLLLDGQRARHRSLAWLAGLIAVGVVTTGLWINTRLALLIPSPGSALNMFVWANYLTLLAFAVLLVAAIRKRREPDKHRRLLAFASIAIIGPAFARFAFWKLFGASGAAGGPLFAAPGMLLMILAVVGYDLAARRKIQAATVVGAAAVIGSLIVGVGAGATGTGFRLIQQFHVHSSQPTADTVAAPH
jgi:hypothetical protein